MTEGTARKLRTVVPWLIAALTLAWLFYTIPARDLAWNLRRVPLGWFIALVVAHVLAILVADSFATWITLRRALPETRPTFRAVLHIRATTWLLAVLHYGIGQGGIAYLIHRRYKVVLSRTAGAVMLTMGVNLILVALSATLGIALGGAPASPTQRLVVIGLAAASPLYLLVIALRPGFLARRAVLAPLFDAGVRGHLVAAAARLPHLAVLITGHLVAMHLFGIDTPVDRGLALLPVVFVIGNLPITPSGLGTAQAAAVALFTPWASEPAQVLAYSLSLQALGLVAQALVGLAFLKSLGRADTIE